MSGENSLLNDGNTAKMIQNHPDPIPFLGLAGQAGTAEQQGCPRNSIPLTSWTSKAEKIRIAAIETIKEASIQTIFIKVFGAAQSLLVNERKKILQINVKVILYPLPNFWQIERGNSHLECKFFGGSREADRPRVAKKFAQKIIIDQ